MAMRPEGATDRAKAIVVQEERADPHARLREKTQIKITSDYTPQGDQPAAIEQLVDGVNRGHKKGIRTVDAHAIVERAIGGVFESWVAPSEAARDRVTGNIGAQAWSAPKRRRGDDE